MKTTVKSVPEGYHTATPYLIITKAAKAIEFYKQAFGATELTRLATPDGKVAHAEFKIGDSCIMLADEFPAVSDDFLRFVLDQLSEWGGISVRRMFGGAGLYRDGKMFGLIADDVTYLKVDESNRDDFVKAGSSPFNPYLDKAKTTVMSYYTIPPEVLENRSELACWAQRSLEIQVRKEQTTPRRSSRPR